MRCSDALSPASVTATSPGTSLSSPNTMKVDSTTTGTACNRRRPMMRRRMAFNMTKPIWQNGAASSRGAV